MPCNSRQREVFIRIRSLCIPVEAKKVMSKRMPATILGSTFFEEKVYLVLLYIAYTYP